MIVYYATLKNSLKRHWDLLESSCVILNFSKQARKYKRVGMTKRTKHRSPVLVGVQDNTRFLWFGYMSNQRPATKAWWPSDFRNAWLQKNLSAKSWKLPPNGWYRIFSQSPSTPALQMLLICPMMDSITNLSFCHWICLIWIMLEIYEAAPSDRAPSNIYWYPSFILFYLAEFFELWESGWLTEFQSHSYN